MKWVMGGHMFSSKTHKNLIIVFLMYKKYNLGENRGPRYSSFLMISDIILVGEPEN